MRVFLGGTCNDSTWRSVLIKSLDKFKIEYFNPVIDDWTPECQEIERQEKEKCDVELYVITPLMTGVFSIAEAVNASHKKVIGFSNKSNTIFCVLDSDLGKTFDDSQLRSFNAVGEMIVKNGGVYLKSLNDVVIELCRMNIHYEQNKIFDDKYINLAFGWREKINDLTHPIPPIENNTLCYIESEEALIICYENKWHLRFAPNQESTDRVVYWLSSQLKFVI